MKLTHFMMPSLGDERCIKSTWVGGDCVYGV